MHFGERKYGKLLLQYMQLYKGFFADTQNKASKIEGKLSRLSNQFLFFMGESEKYYENLLQKKEKILMFDNFYYFMTKALFRVRKGKTTFFLVSKGDFCTMVGPLPGGRVYRKKLL